MKIGIIGLGLMGGSFSYDIKELYPNAEISGFDISKENTTTAIKLGIISSLLDIKKISDFNIIIVSVPVDKSIDVLKKESQKIIDNFPKKKKKKRKKYSQNRFHWVLKVGKAVQGPRTMMQVSRY